MIFKDALCGVTKAVKNNPARDKIRDALNSLRTSPNQGVPDTLDYAARQQHAQLCGYLAVDDNRDRIKDGGNPFPIVPLTKEVRSCLEVGHREFIKFNNTCLRFITPELEPCRFVLDPYSRFNVKLVEVGEGMGLIEENLVEIEKAFAEIGPVQRILRNPPKGLELLNRDQFAAAVHHIKGIILTAGVSNTPEDIGGLLRDRSNTAQSVMGRFVLDLISAMSVLEIADQLIYQAVIQDQLLVINEENIISIDGETRHALGTGVEIECQPNSNLFFDAVSSVVLLDYEVGGSKTHAFCRVDSETISFGRDHGSSVKLRLRYLDDELNPYFGAYGRGGP